MWPLVNQLHLKYWLLRKFNRERHKDVKAASACFPVNRSVSVSDAFSFKNAFRLLSPADAANLGPILERSKKVHFPPGLPVPQVDPRTACKLLQLKTTFQANPPALDEKDWSLNEHPRWQQCWGANHLNSASTHSHILERFPRATPRQPLLARVKRWALWAIASTGKGSLVGDWTQSKEDICCQHGHGNAWQWGKIIVWP